MPELPEVEAIVRRLRPEAVGAALSGSKSCGRASCAQKPSVLQRLSEKGSRLLNGVARISFFGCRATWRLRVHLRMTGILRVIPDARLYTASTRVLFTLERMGRGVAFEDRRILGTVHLHHRRRNRRETRQIGPEPLTKSFTAKYLIECCEQVDTADQDLSDGSAYDCRTGQYLCGRSAICRSDSSGDSGEPDTRTEAANPACEHPQGSYERAIRDAAKNFQGSGSS